MTNTAPLAAGNFEIEMKRFHLSEFRIFHYSRVEVPRFETLIILLVRKVYSTNSDLF